MIDQLIIPYQKVFHLNDVIHNSTSSLPGARKEWRCKARPLYLILWVKGPRRRKSLFCQDIPLGSNGYEG